MAKKQKNIRMNFNIISWRSDSACLATIRLCVRSVSALNCASSRLRFLVVARYFRRSSSRFPLAISFAAVRALSFAGLIVCFPAARLALFFSVVRCRYAHSVPTGRQSV